MRSTAVGLMLVLCAATVGAQTFNVSLAGGREAGGGGDPAGKGLALVTFDGTAAKYYLWVRDIEPPSGARINSGVAGQAGTSVVDLAPSFSSPTAGVYVAAGSVTTDAATVQALLQQPNAHYVEVSNAPFPDGAVRGQLLGDGPSAFAFTTTLAGSRVPGGGDPAGGGYAVALIDGTTLYYYIQLKGVASPSAAQIHSGLPGQSGPLTADLAPTFSNGVASGSVTLAAGTATQIAARPGEYYVNLTDAAFPNGALRGQLKLSETDVYFPVAARNPGLGTSVFKTDLRIVNLSDDAATVFAEWYPKGAAGASAPANVTPIAIVPRGEAVVDDAVSVLFAANDRGAIRLLSTFPIRAVVHNFNDQRAAGSGTFGLSLDGSGYDGAVTSGLLVFNSHRPKTDHLDFRTNIGYFNPNPTDVVVTFNVRTPDGALVAPPSTRTFPAWANDQGFFYQTIPGIPADKQTLANFFVTFNATRPIFIFSAVVDNLTDDAFQQAAMPVGPGATEGSSAPPTATITTPTGAITPAAGQAVSFAGTGTDPAGLTLVGHWDFGDGVSADGFSVTHTFANAGTFTVTFTVTNAVGTTSAPVQQTVTVTALAATLSAIQEQIFTPICSRCHPPNQGMDLRAGNAWANIVGVSSAEQPGVMRVKAGDPDNSYLYRKVQGVPGITGSRMPFGGPFLTPEQLQLIHDWIQAGAQNN